MVGLTNDTHPIEIPDRLHDYIYLKELENILIRMAVDIKGNDTQEKWKELSKLMNQPIGVCPNCGRPLMSSGPCICAQLVHHDRPIILEDLVNRMKDLDPEYNKIIDEHFWELA